MSTNTSAKLMYESNVTATAMSALTDSGDQTTFTSAASLFSEQSGYAPDIRPNGIVTGAVVIPAAAGGTDDVDVSACTCYLSGVLTTVNADTDIAITRPATDVAIVNSLTILANGTYSMVAGAESATTAFSATRGASGGPPFIPTTSIEVAQIRVTEHDATVISTSEIFSTVGTHRERSDSPAWTVDNFTGTVTFDDALPNIHTGSVPKKVYASYAEPIFVEQQWANDFKPSENTHSTSSTQVYNDTIGSSSSSLGQGSFTAILKDGITDDILTKADETLFFKFYQDRYKTAHILTQGKFGVQVTFGASDHPKATCTISSLTKSQRKSA